MYPPFLLRLLIWVCSVVQAVTYPHQIQIHPHYIRHIQEPYSMFGFLECEANPWLAWVATRVAGPPYNNHHGIIFQQQYQHSNFHNLKTPLSLHSLRCCWQNPN